MNAIESQVRELVLTELAAANRKHPPFHSQHEGIAVIWEEVEESKEVMEFLTTFVKEIWGRIRENEDVTTYVSGRIKNTAVMLACEAIQVAAMCKKFEAIADH